MGLLLLSPNQQPGRLLGHREPLFIKNVENLQGDERDVIFVSYTYGPDAGGVVAQSFYPINTEKGFRRQDGCMESMWSLTGRLHLLCGPVRVGVVIRSRL